MITSTPTLSDRLLRLSIKFLLLLLNRTGFLRSVDLSAIMTDYTERLLNLPGKLPFFPTKVTDAKAVKALLTKLHPVSCSKELIRLGPVGDGGYLVPNDLEGIEACFSPGVSTVAGFEVDCAQRGMKVFMADASVTKPPVDHPQFRFIPKFLGATTQGKFVSLGDWVNDSLEGSMGDLLLQMDIEGYEYETLLSAPAVLLERFRIIVIEFHYLDYLFSEPVFPFYRQVFEKLLQTHTCVHSHPNNCCGTIKMGDMELIQMGEMTFLRNDRVENPAFVRTFPHRLDSDNTNRPTVCLPQSFYHDE